jgi:iron complex outermembrane recepter protein
MSFNRKLLAVAIGLAGAMAYSFAIAEDLSAKDKSSAPVIEEIIVTAQKVAENLQKVPIAVTALTSEDLQKMGIVNVEGLSQVVLPGLMMGSTIGRQGTPSITMRGIQAQDPAAATQDAAVAILEDGVFNPRSAATGTGAAEIEQVELLRGPQGTLFGRNAEGGAIVVTTKEPTGELGGSVKVGGGNYGQHTEEIHLNTPAVGNWSFKLDVKDDGHNGYVKNIATTSDLSAHDDFGKFDNNTYRFSVQYKPTEDLKFNYFYEDGFMQETAGYALHGPVPSICQNNEPCQSGFGASFAMPASTVNNYVTNSWIGLYESPTTYKTTMQRLGVDWQLQDNLTLKSFTSASTLDNVALGWNDNGAFAKINLGPGIPGFLFTPAFGTAGLAAGSIGPGEMITGLAGIDFATRVTSKSIGQEFQLIGKSAEIKWVGGLYAFKETTTDSLTNAYTLAYTGADATDPVPVDPIFGPGGLGNVGTFTTMHVQSEAAFFQMTWTPTGDQNLHVTPGLRVSHDARQYQRSVEDGLPVDETLPDYDKTRLDESFSIAYGLSCRQRQRPHTMD